jgi:ribulose-5-phosphate 4-epimerase/fuculose-1-phosphate aldolase
MGATIQREVPTPSQAGLAEAQARADLAAAFRLAVRHDLHEGVCNHFSVALPGGRFLLNRYGLHWSETTASSLLMLDASGRVLAGEGEYEATAFHILSRFHLAHPAAVCVLHTHMPYTTALAITEPGRLEMVEQNALRFHDDIAYDDNYGGLVMDHQEGDRLARLIGGKRVLFLANHGVIVWDHRWPALSTRSTTWSARLASRSWPAQPGGLFAPSGPRSCGLPASGWGRRRRPRPTPTSPP